MGEPGPQGPQGDPGVDGQSVGLASEPAGPNCEWGGVAMFTATDTLYTCNGAPGPQGESVSVTGLDPGFPCAAGGVEIRVGESSSYVCNGQDADLETINDLEQRVTQLENLIAAVFPNARMFVTSMPFNGDLGGVEGADALCTSLANLYELGGTWHAWISSTDLSVSDRIIPNQGPYRLLDGTIVAFSWTDLIDGNIEAPINVNEQGNYMSSVTVWTGTLIDGSASGSDCMGWTSATAPDGTYGYTDFSLIFGGGWTNIGTTTCADAASLYCIEDGPIFIGPPV